MADRGRGAGALRRGGRPLAAAELAEATRAEVQALLDESLPTSWWF
ncbi:MAG: hypothetical protein R2711_17780 [Acidimicrobiales bacterium]